MEKTKIEIKKEINKEIYLAFMPLVIIFLIEIFFTIMCFDIKAILVTEPRTLIFSSILGYSIYGIILSITKRTSKATTIFSISLYILLLLNQIKIIYTGEPVLFSDIKFLGEIGDLATMISSNMTNMMIPYIITFIILAIILYLIIRWNKNNEIEIKNRKIRLSILILNVIIIGVLFIPNENTKNLYLKIFFDNDNYADYNSYTTNYSLYQKYTMLSGMYNVLLNNRFSEPEDYDEEKLSNILEEVDNKENEKKLGKPNIIVVFSEAFWDIDKLDEIKFNKEIAGNFKELAQQGKLIETLTCSYGGMSENVAFELLTGGSMNYFQNGYIPVMSLYPRKNSTEIPSIVNELNKNNYETNIVFGKDYYNSQKTFEKIGFNKYLELKETKDNIKGKYISDEYIIDNIIESFENKSSEKRMFYMVETIQNHMTYNLNKYDRYDIQIENSELDKDIKNTLLSYAQGIFDADKQLKRLYEYIQSKEEPTIILFLGDHLPYLYTEKGKNAIDKLNYFNTENKLEDMYKKYNTQTLILSNYEIDYEEFPQYLSVDMILTYIINNMDIDISSYYKWLYTTISDLPAINKYVSLDNEGTIYDTNKLTDNMKENYNLREKMQFKFFIKPTK